MTGKQNESRLEDLVLRRHSPEYTAYLYNSGILLASSSHKSTSNRAEEIVWYPRGYTPPPPTTTTTSKETWNSSLGWWEFRDIKWRWRFFFCQDVSSRNNTKQPECMFSDTLQRIYLLKWSFSANECCYLNPVNVLILWSDARMPAHTHTCTNPDLWWWDISIVLSKTTQ